MKLTSKEVAHVASLARLEMAEDEMEKFAGQLNAILEFADKLNRLETKDILPTAHVLPLNNVFREDRVTPGLERKAALLNAPEAEEGMFRVPRVIE
ncbi:MAG: Asp-tRNA(Asn)/Glu-tRNA(Gln) amidotransferase subunit GatC [Dethiobacter sp.]|jgi:aspartyl-tRNA(Asn)/glutamyl-tRNA(Gln) amidotransferase subunit C|nr:Asp-tRNA(Asn)/Glu-tRNA(Gln) amidotransferase subunit GatC [Dethiobacter sp.]MBS3898875.1 Asp-tRNA(Asn)/Glu-tRNA(Gln) amidotransferase subunit GatC [Dethiobacter sp.]